MKKLLILLLATMMILSTFTACGEVDTPASEPTETGTEDSSESGSTSTTEQESESTTENIPSVLDGVKFNNETLNVFSWTPTNLVEYVGAFSETSSMVEKAVFDRCDSAENRLNVRTKWELWPMLPEYDEAYIEAIDLANSNGGQYDIVVNVSTFSHALAVRGVYSNLNKQAKYFDFEHPAWPTSLIEDVTIGNKLYFATGDISTNLVFMTSVVFFNKSLVKDLGINQKVLDNWGEKDLYSLVTSGKWTLDKMLTLCENTYKDLNNDGKKNAGDRFGQAVYDQLVDNYYYGGGYQTVLAQGESFSVSEDFLNVDLVGTLLTTVNTFLYDTKDGFCGEHGDIQGGFADGRILFAMAPASHAYKKHSEVADLEYSVLPIPKHSESQERYACTQSFPYSMYGVCSQSKYLPQAAAFMQALAEESYTITRPALFDKLMKGRYAEDPEDAEMWEYAVDANVFDVGRIFNGAFAVDGQALTTTLFRGRVENDNDNWGQALGSYAGPLSIAAFTLAGQILALPD